MTDSGTLHDDVERDFVARMDDWIGELDIALNLLQRTRGAPHEPPISEPNPKVDAAIVAIEKAKKSIEASKANLALVNDVLTVRKTSLELKEVVLRSRPRSAFVERMTWVATALFPAGGIPFVLAGGVNDASIIVAGVVWVVATAIMVTSLGYLKKDDDERRELFKKEFGEQ